MADTNGQWEEYRRLVLHELERFQAWLEQLTDRAGSLDSNLHQEITKNRRELDDRINILRQTAESDLKRERDKLEKEIAQARRDIAALKVKAGMFGLVAGAIPALIAIVWKLLS